ncbi:adenylate/guanylate cyclase domain-containing protein [Aureibaculum luteum]|uniref:adenylate/guanylate cyclase domain-containing protein n=1 Tax=Aureibaculum luteum TaxID=1548456 RepID=UPI001E4BE2A8|nr:adenylate/guanylate cyclase domain-containing protein [Aureibaculum luteum]
MLNRSVVIGLVCFISMHALGQTSIIDSLKQIVDSSKKDTSLVKNLNALSIEVLNNEDIAGSLVFSKQANELADQLGFLKGKAYAQKSIGLAEYYQGNYLQVLDNWTESLKIFENIKDTLGIANMVNNLGAVFYSQGVYDKALDYYLRSLNISEDLKDTLRITTALVNIGGAYSDGVKNYDKALNYYNQLKPYLTPLNNDEVTTTYLMGVGEIYFKQGDYEKSLNFYLEALTLNNTSYQKNQLNLLLGQVQFKRGNNELAIAYLNEAYESSLGDNQQLQVLLSLIAFGDVYQQIDFSKAITYYKDAEFLAKQIEAPDLLRDIYKGMSKSYIANNDFKNAYLYQSQFLVLKDSVFNLETDDKIRGLQFDFDMEKKEDQIGLLEKEAEISSLNEKRQKIVKYISFIIAGLIFLLALGLYRRNKFIQKTKKIIEEEKNRSDKLLLNILPEETAIELKEKGKVQAKQFNSVTVLFTDFKGFTQYSEHLSPEALVETIGFYFSKFDEIVKSYGLEKIKTIGDAYMCAGGLPFPTVDHAQKMIRAAFDIAEFVAQTKKNEEAAEKIFDIRIGINTGPVVAGVVGSTKFAYDIWGDTVNVASRMESMGEPGRINISENTYNLIKDDFVCKYRGEIEAKNRGKLKMYFVNGIKEKVISEVTTESVIDV